MRQRWMYSSSWPAAAVLVLVFGAMATITVRNSRFSDRLMREIREYVEPASIAAAAVHTSMNRCEQALANYQANGLPQHVEEYVQEFQTLLRHMHSVELLAAALGTQTLPALKHLRNSVENWDAFVRRNRLIAAPRDPVRLRALMMDHAKLVSAASEAVEILQGQLRFEITNRQRRTATAESRAGLFVLIACFLGLAGMFWLNAYAREVERSLKLRDEVLRIVSHDLLNPLNTIHLAVSLWKANTLSSSQPFADIISRAVRRMARLVHDLRDSLLVDSGHSIPLHVEPVPVTPLIEEVREAAECLATEKSIQLESKTPSGPIFVAADRVRLLQVLFNLIDNAIKFTPKNGRIVIECQLEVRHLRFAVTDTGPGIPDDELKKVFDLYWQAAATAHLGSGLGLATSKRIVEQHGGRIWVDSTPGKGSTFAFTVPYSDAVGRAA